MKDDLFYMPMKIGDVELRNPFIVASGPTAKRVDQLELEKCGWAAASIKQTFNPYPYINYEPRYRWLKKEKLHVFTAEFRLDMESGLRLMEEGRKKCKNLVLIANYSYVKDDLEGWKDAARRFDAAGAQILELNFCCPNMSFNVDVSERMNKEARPSSGASMGQDENSVRLVIEEGWANYYRNGAAKRTFDKLDRYVFWKLWRWINRRHPTKSGKWKQQRYFSAARPKGTFRVRAQRRNGGTRVLQLYRLASTTIERHIKVRGAANPFDPAYTEYFKRRRCFAWRVRQTGGASRVAAQPT